MKQWLRGALVLAVLACLSAGTALAQNIDPNGTYRLTNAFLGPGRSLDTYSDGGNKPFMGKTGDATGQMWKLTRLDTAPARSGVRTFADYPAGEVYKGATAPVVLTPDDRAFETRLKWAAANLKPNFAGHYILTTWGCGAECVMGAVIDAQTGKVSWWDFTVCCWGTGVSSTFNPIEARPDSRLVVFTGLRNQKAGDLGAHYYEFKDGQFVFIRSVPKAQP